MTEHTRGPLAGEELPVHGGTPGLNTGCGGCIACCHLPEIAVTEEEVENLQALYAHLGDTVEPLVIRDDPKSPGWRIMSGPCVFRSSGGGSKSRGCSIYDQRPASCRVFTCDLLLNLRRAAAENFG